MWHNAKYFSSTFFLEFQGFLAVANGQDLSPSGFAGKFDLYSIGLSVKDGYGASIMGGFGLSEKWNIYQLGAGVGAGGYIAGAIFRGTSYTYMLNDEKPTRNRSITDLLNNLYQVGRYGFTWYSGY